MTSRLCWAYIVGLIVFLFFLTIGSLYAIISSDKAVFAGQIEVKTDRPCWLYLLDGGGGGWWQITRYNPGQRIVVHDGGYIAAVSCTFNPDEPEHAYYQSGIITANEVQIIGK